MPLKSLQVVLQTHVLWVLLLSCGLTWALIAISCGLHGMHEEHSLSAMVWLLWAFLHLCVCPLDALLLHT